MASRHELSVTAFDGGQPRRSASLDIQLTVTDANDHSPQFASPRYEVRIAVSRRPTHLYLDCILITLACYFIQLCSIYLNFCGPHFVLYLPCLCLGRYVKFAL